MAEKGGQSDLNMTKRTVCRCKALQVSVSTESFDKGFHSSSACVCMGALPFICSELEIHNLFDNCQFCITGESEQSIPGHPDQNEEQGGRDYFFRYTSA